MNQITTDFDLNCRECSRLSTFLDVNKKPFPDDHCSRYNTSKKRLTMDMFEDDFKLIDGLPGR